MKNIQLVLAIMMILFPAGMHAQKIVSPVPEFRPDSLRLEAQNRLARSLNLTLVEDAHTLNDLVADKILVEVPESGEGFYLSRYVREPFALPEVRELIEKLGEAYSFSFRGDSLKITSLVRTRKSHARISRWNMTAASCKTALRCSPHMYGVVFDISKRGMTSRQLRWLRETLLLLHTESLVDVFEEMYANNFHVLVRADDQISPVASRP